MAKQSIEDIVQDFHNGDLEVQKYFSDYDTFFNFLKARNAIDWIDIDYDDKGLYWTNYFLIWLSQNDPEKFNELVLKEISDVEVENGKAYLKIDDVGELSKLFCSNRNSFDASTIEKILQGEHDFDYYDYSTDDVYRDVIDELTPENTKILYQYIVNELKDKKILPVTDLMEEIAIEQGHPEYFEVNSENISKIVDDEETMNDLLSESLSELKGSLYSIHNNSYNSAYSDDIYEGIWKELDDIFIVDEKQFSTRPHNFKKDVSVEFLKIPIRDFNEIILNYLDNGKGYRDGTLEYFGNFLSIIQEGGECLKFYPPDYPDFRKVDKHINEYFRDYL